MRRKLQVSKGESTSFPDKMERVLNFERWSGLHSCGSWWCRVLLILQASSCPEELSLKAQTVCGTCAYTLLAPWSSSQELSQL